VRKDEPEQRFHFILDVLDQLVHIVILVEVWDFPDD